MVQKRARQADSGGTNWESVALVLSLMLVLSLGLVAALGGGLVTIASGGAAAQAIMTGAGGFTTCMALGLAIVSLIFRR